MMLTHAFAKSVENASAVNARQQNVRRPLGGQALTKASKPDPRSYRRKHLAEKILPSRSALEGERKQVTALFADVKEPTDLAELWPMDLVARERARQDPAKRWTSLGQGPTMSECTRPSLPSRFGMEYALVIEPRGGLVRCARNWDTIIWSTI